MKGKFSYSCGRNFTIKDRFSTMSLNTFGKLCLASVSTKRNECRKTSPCFANYTDDDADKRLRIFSSWKMCHLGSHDIIFVLFSDTFCFLYIAYTVQPSFYIPSAMQQSAMKFMKRVEQIVHEKALQQFCSFHPPRGRFPGNPAFILQARIRLLILLAVNHTVSNSVRASWSCSRGWPIAL